MDPGEASYFQYLIVILWWMVDIGCVDICYEVSIMYSHHEKEDELSQIIHIYINICVKKHHYIEM